MKVSYTRTILVLTLTLLSSSIFAQSEMSKPKSAYERFLSDQGTMITKDFYQMPSLASSYQKVEAKVVKLTSGKGTQYFYSLSIKEKYGDKSAIIAKQDLLEISKALETIITRSKSEAATNLEYRERYFETNDGFKIGYYQKGAEQTFFADLDDYQSKDTVFFDDFSSLKEAVSKAITKINSLGG